MKRTLLIIALVGAMLSVTAYVVCLAVPLQGSHIKGSGRIVTKQLPAPAFDAIDASRAVKVVLSDAASDIRIEADDNLIEHVVVREVRGELEVTLDKSLKNIQKGDITVTVPVPAKIRSLAASSASKITSEATLKADELRIDATSAADIQVSADATSCGIRATSASKVRATVKASACSIQTTSAAKVAADVTADDCSVDATSASKIVLSGSAATLRAELTSASKLDAGKFTAADAVIRTTSAASATIDCSRKLTAEASSGSSIRYTGDCQTSLTKSSGGSIRKD